MAIIQQIQADEQNPPELRIFSISPERSLGWHVSGQVRLCDG
jgi:hypothetical protein